MTNSVTGGSVTVTHIATKQTETCSSERSQHRNKETALQTLKAKIWAKTNRLPPDEEFSIEFSE